MDLISRQAAQKVADDCSDEHRYAKDSRWPETYSPYHEGWTDACDTIFARLESVPTADVRPVVRGRWMSFDRAENVALYDSGFVCQEVYCSVCGKYLGGSDEYEVKGNFCPNCGADMREGKR